MAKKETKVSINKLETALLSHEEEFVLNDSDNVVIKVKYTLTLTEMLQFVEDVVSLCVDTSTGEYAPEVQDYAVRYNTIISYTNARMPSDVSKAYDLLYNTDIFEQTLECINESQYDSICDAVNRKIKHSREVIVANLTTEMSKLVGKMDAFTKSAEEMFGNVSGESMAKLMDKLANADNIDEKTLVKAVFEAQKSEGDNKTEESPKLVVVSKE